MDVISFLGTDCHRPNSFYSKMNEIKATYKKVIGEEKFELLSEINPRKIIEDEYISVE
jgi:tyrosine-protein phosphatase YwqE